MSFHNRNFVPLVLEQTEDDAAEKLFQVFLQNSGLSETDRTHRESILMALPLQLKKADHRKMDNVVLFPFGIFYHGLGFKDSPLTAFVATGTDFKPSQPQNNGGPLNDDDDNSSTGSIHSSDDDSSSSETDEKADNTDRGRMRQSLLLEINDVLTSPDNQLHATYKNVTLTRHGKLSFLDNRHSIPCFLEARSFLPVQRSRLIKFYCLLEQLFWPFSQLIIHFAGNTGILDKTQQSEGDELKPEQLLLLIIFFLVRRQIIPSFKILKEWALTQLIVDDINVAFCENVDVVRKNCQMMGIGTRPEEWTMERILQLVFEFLTEMSTFDFYHYGLAPSTGTSFDKLDTGSRSSNMLLSNNARRLHTNSVICIQDILDPCENVTKKITASWGVHFQLRCKNGADKLFPLLWSGNLLNAVLLLMEADDPKTACGHPCNVSNKGYYQWESGPPNLKPMFTPDPLRRCIKFKVPPHFLQLLNHCHAFAEGLGSSGASEQAFKVAMMTLFHQFLKEFNVLFWKKLVAARLTRKNDDPVNVDFIDHVHCPVTFSKEEQAMSVVKAIMKFFTSTVVVGGAMEDPSGITTFYVVDDWTKEGRNDILMFPVEKPVVAEVIKSFLHDIKDPTVVYGKRRGSPKRSQLLAAVELSAGYEGNYLYLNTLVEHNASIGVEEGSRLQQILSWYNVSVKSFIVKKFIKWIGGHVMKKLEEKYSLLLAASRRAKRAAQVTTATTTPVTASAPPATKSGDMSSSHVPPQQQPNSVAPRVVNVAGSYLLPRHFTDRSSMSSRCAPGMTPTWRHSAPVLNTSGSMSVGRGRGFGSRGRGRNLPIMLPSYPCGRGKRGGTTTYRKSPY